jgi:hypothetical protein
MFGYEIDWDFFGKLSNVVQVFSVLPWLLTAYLFWSRAKKYKELMKQQKGATSGNPRALAIGLVGTGDISGQVKQFLAANNLNMRVEPFYLPSGKGITSDNIQTLLRSLLKIKSKLTSEGITELHLFIASPVAFGVAVGALLDNWVPVKVYHSHKTVGYELWTLLHKGYVPGVEDSMLKDLVDAEL